MRVYGKVITQFIWRTDFMDNQQRDDIIGSMLNEGIGLSEIQKHLESEHSYKITYMDLRLLSADLEVNWKKIDGTDQVDETDLDAEQDVEEEAEVTLETGTRIEISKIVRPGAMLSGDVTFNSGIEAEWYVDQMGRLGLNPKVEGEQPSEEDLEEFQIKLQEEVQKQQMF